MQRFLHTLMAFYFIVSYLTCYAQRSNKSDFLNVNPRVNSLNVPLDSSVLYFPSNLFAKTEPSTKELERFNRLNVYFAKMLFAFQEPLLFNTTDNKETYRFTWLRTRDKPISIRISKIADKVTLQLKTLSGISGYYVGRLAVHTNITLKTKQWEKFKRLIAKSDYWNLSSTDNNIGTDGAYWGLEGSTSDSYHCVIRWTPEKSRFREACLYLVSLSGLKIKKKDIY